MRVQCCGETQTDLYENQCCKVQREVWFSGKPYKLFEPLPTSNPADSAHTSVVQLTRKSIIVTDTIWFLILPCNASPQVPGNSYMVTVPMKWLRPIPVWHITTWHLSQGFFFDVRDEEANTQRYLSYLIHTTDLKLVLSHFIHWK